MNDWRSSSLEIQGIVSSRILTEVIPALGQLSDVDTAGPGWDLGDDVVAVLVQLSSCEDAGDDLA